MQFVFSVFDISANPSNNGLKDCPLCSHIELVVGDQCLQLRVTESRKVNAFVDHLLSKHITHYLRFHSIKVF